MPKKFGLERGDYQDFLSKNICLTVRKISVGGANPLAFHSFWASIKFGRGGGGRQYQDFPSKFFCLTVPEEFLREHFRVSLISGMGNFLLQRVMSRFSILCRNFFVSQC